MNKLLILLSFVAVLCSCNKENVFEDDLIPRHDIILTKAQHDFVNNNNVFALNLFNKIAEKEAGKSLICSPLSATFAMGMIANGADGDTRKQITNALGYTESDMKNLNEFCKTMIKESSAIDPSTKIAIANAAVINKRKFLPLNNDFKKDIESFFDALIYYKDFEKEDVIKEINTWCKKKTEGMIPWILPDSELPDDAYAYFLNSVFFRGIWNKPFNHNDSKSESFKKDDGSFIKVNMMHQNNPFYCNEFTGVCDILCLPYGNGAYEMILILPTNKNDLTDLKQLLDLSFWENICALAHEQIYEADIAIPSFETETYMDLKDIFIDMGIKDAFGSKANLSNMTNKIDAHISEIKQKTKVMVDEQGSKAASVTAIKIVGNTGFKTTPMKFEFHADHPFLYAITEVSTGAIIFMGQYTGR